MERTLPTSGVDCPFPVIPVLDARMADAIGVGLVEAPIYAISTERGPGRRNARDILDAPSL